MEVQIPPYQGSLSQENQPYSQWHPSPPNCFYQVKTGLGLGEVMGQMPSTGELTAQYNWNPHLQRALPQSRKPHVPSKGGQQDVIRWREPGFEEEVASQSWTQGLSTLPPGRHQQRPP